MKRFLTMLLILCTALRAATEDKLVAEWDFGKNAKSDLAGNFPGGYCRGKAKIVDGWLGDDSEFTNVDSGYQVGKTIYPELTPTEGFRVEAVCKVNEISKTQRSLICDNKHLFVNKVDDTHHGFAFGFTRNQKVPSKLRFVANLGFADHSAGVDSKEFEINDAEEHLFVMNYNGCGRVEFFVDGKRISQHRVDGMGLAPAIKPFVIADRVGSGHQWLDGKIRSLKLYAFAAQTIDVKFSGRAAFVRGEKDATLKFDVTNHGDKVVSDIKYECKVGGKPVAIQAEADRIEGGKSTAIVLPVDTAMSVGEYPIEIAVTGKSGSGVVNDVMFMTLRLGPARPPEEFPVVMWGGWSDKELLKKSGFTHNLGGFALSVYNSNDMKATAEKITGTLDGYVAAGFKRADYFTLGHNNELKKKFPRYSREGDEKTNNIEASNLEYQKLVSDIAAKTAQIIAGHPGCDALLVNSEVRDRTSPSFGKYEPAAFEKFAGYPIPKEIGGEGPNRLSLRNTNFKTLEDFPFTRVVSDKNPYLTYFKWFWKEGDGWNVVQSIVNDQYHKYIHRPFWTFFDPAVRVPPVWGSGGSVDYISHWSVSYPDPIRPAAPTDELIAMAAGRPGQKVMAMAQIISPRGTVAPVGVHPENEPAWVKDSPEGPYITIPPDSLKEAIWSIIARQVHGIMFHGDGCLWGKPGNKGYVMTNPDTKFMIARLLNDVVKPLGPTLKRIPEREPKVAMLESFAASVFAGRGTWGYNNWQQYTHYMLQWAKLSQAVI